MTLERNATPAQAQEFTARHEGEKATSLHLYLPGISASNQGMAEIYLSAEKRIQAEYPGAKFEGKNSSVGTDLIKLPELDRPKVMARDVVRALDAGQDVHLYGHSMGAIEVSRVLDVIARLRPDLLKKGSPDLQKLHITFMSPLGFGKDFGQSLTMLFRAMEVTKAGKESSGHVYGLETLAYIPLKAKGADKNAAQFMSAAEQAQIMTEAFKDESQFGAFGEYEDAATLNEVASNPDDDVSQKRFDRLTPQEKEALYLIDDFILIHQKRGDMEALKADMKRRGDLLAKYTQDNYAGRPVTEDTAAYVAQKEAEADQATWRMYASALKGILGIGYGVLAGKSYHELKRWYQAGADITFMVPEFDVLVKLSEISDFLEPEDSSETNMKSRVVNLRGSTHASQGTNRRLLNEGISAVAAFSKALAKKA